MKSKISSVMTIGALAILLGCGGNGGSSAAASRGEGSLSVIANFEEQTRAAPGYVDTVSVTVTPPTGVILPGNFPNPFLLTRDSPRLLLEELRSSDEGYGLIMDALTDGTVVGIAQSEAIITRDAIQQIDVSTDLESRIAGIDMFPAANGIVLGASFFFRAHALDEDTAVLFSGLGFIWSSSNPDVLSVDRETGLVTTHREGEAVVTAAIPGTTHSVSSLKFVVSI